MKFKPLLLFLVVLALVSNCQKKKYPPQLSTVSPNSAPIGADITLSGSQFGDSPTVTIGSNNVPTKTKTDASITLTVPQMATGATTIRVTNADGSSDPLPFTVLRSQPQNLDFSPKSGQPGSEVLITGQYLDDVTEVKFSGGNSSAAAIINRNGGIRVRVPDNAQSGSICLYGPAGQVCTSGSYSVLLPPSLDNISPDKGVSGTEVTLYGSNLSGVQEVKFGNQTVSVKSGDNGKVVVSCPDFGSVQTVQVTIRTSSGTTGSRNFTGAPKPSIDKSRCIPTAVIAGSTITLKGSNFNTVNTVRFTNGSVSRDQFIRIETNEITVKVPSNTNSGLVQLVNEYGAGDGVPFDKVTGGSGLTSDNIATNVGNIITGVISDGCDPTAFFYCMPNRQYEIGFRQSSSRCQKTYYTTQQIAGSTYEVFTGARTDAGGTITSTNDILKLERNGQNNDYTGFAILITSSDTYMGSMTQSKDIYLYSVTNGTLQKMCRRDISRFSYPTSTVCSDCK